MPDAEVATAYVGLGSNLGDGQAILRGAWQALGEVAGIVPARLSSPYTTAPVGMSSRHWFTNAVGRLEVSLDPLALLGVLLTVEASFGRRRSPGSPGYEDRILDLDLLYYDAQVLETAELVLPHPRIQERLFVLAPLAELSPELLDSRSGLTVAAMTAALRHRLAAQGGAAAQEIIREAWRQENGGTGPAGITTTRSQETGR